MEHETHGNRKHERRQFKTELPLAVTILGQSTPITIRARDVSEQGLGVLLNHYFATGTRLFITFAKCTIRVEVAWCNQQPSHEGMHMCGLRILSEKADLLFMIQRAGIVLH